MKDINTTIDFSLWNENDILMKAVEGGGFSGNFVLADDEKFGKCFLMENRKQSYDRVRFVNAIKYANSGNTYCVKVWLKLSSDSAFEKANLLIGNMSLLDTKREQDKSFEVSKKWTECEWTFTLKDKFRNCISIEQSEDDKEVIPEILIGKIEVTLISGEPNEEKEEKDFSFKESSKNTIHLVGDSIVTIYGEDTLTRGWGMYIGEKFDEEKLIVNNMAVGGYSTKTFLKAIAGFRRWNFVKDNIKKGDFLIISLGINDMSSSKNITRITEDEYKKNLQQMLDEVKGTGVTVILATPTITINNNPIDNFRRNMAEAMIEVANNNNEKDRDDLYLIDLNQAMYEKLKEMEKEIGYDKILKTYYSVNKDGTPDVTHQCEEGSRFVLSIILELLEKTDCKINDYIIKS